MNHGVTIMRKLENIRDILMIYAIVCKIRNCYNVNNCRSKTSI